MKNVNLHNTERLTKPCVSSPGFHHCYFPMLLLFFKLSPNHSVWWISKIVLEFQALKQCSLLYSSLSTLILSPAVACQKEPFFTTYPHSVGLLLQTRNSPLSHWRPLSAFSSGPLSVLSDSSSSFWTSNYQQPYTHHTCLGPKPHSHIWLGPRLGSSSSNNNNKMESVPSKNKTTYLQ